MPVDFVGVVSRKIQWDPYSYIPPQTTNATEDPIAAELSSYLAIQFGLRDRGVGTTPVQGPNLYGL